MTRPWLSILYSIVPIAGLLFAVLIVQTIIPYMIIAVACVIPFAVCFWVADRVPRVALPMIYIVCVAATIWFLATEGDHLLPVGASTGGRHPMDATGVYMAVWTGIVSVLFGSMAVWLMIVEARVRRREALKAAGGARPNGRPPRRHAGKP
jgi:di/tricarboxylate transporter